VKTCTYTKEEVLQIIAEHAGSSLPEDSDGVLKAYFDDNGGVEVIFIEEQGNLLN
jgi:hypothetical protein